MSRRSDISEGLRTLGCRTLIFVGENSPFQSEALHMIAKLDRRCSALVEVWNKHIHCYACWSRKLETNKSLVSSLSNHPSYSLFWSFGAPWELLYREFSIKARWWRARTLLGFLSLAFLMIFLIIYRYRKPMGFLAFLLLDTSSRRWGVLIIFWF